MPPLLISGYALSVQADHVLFSVAWEIKQSDMYVSCLNAVAQQNLSESRQSRKKTSSAGSAKLTTKPKLDPRALESTTIRKDPDPNTLKP